MRIAIVAGEASGDLLAAGLVAKLKAAYPEAIIEGVAGPRMQAAGCHALFSVDELAVMGLFEILRHLPRLLRIRKQLITHFAQNPPDLFIGVDAPDFNLSIEGKLRNQGIPTIHYNSPTVWAWRRYRLKTIARTTNLMLTLYPFEKIFYDEHAIPTSYVGHPLADLIPEIIDVEAARSSLGIETIGKKVVAILPGSRGTELRYLAERFIETAKWCYVRDPSCLFIVPLVNPYLKQQFESLVQKQAADLPIHTVLGQSHEVLAAADVVLLASGTATLEAMLYKKPMVVAYRMSPLTFLIAKWLIKTPYIALPNLLANERLVPELIQDEASVENLGSALMAFLAQPERVAILKERFLALHQRLHCHTDEQAFRAVEALLNK